MKRQYTLVAISVALILTVIGSLLYHSKVLALSIEVYDPRYDINDDDKIDMIDIGIVTRAFGSHPGHPRWNSEADVNQDDKVNLRDISLVAKHFGETTP